MTKPEKRDESWMRALVKSRVDRVRVGSNAMQASTLGLSLLGCLAAGYFGGSWLDNRFGTGFWMPLLTIVGMLAGFVEMFRTIKNISRNSHWPTHPVGEKMSPEQAEKPASGETKHSAIAGSAPEKAIPQEEPQARRSGLFEIPPPPLPEYSQQHAKAKHDLAEEDAPLTSQQIIDRLLDDGNHPPQ